MPFYDFQQNNSGGRWIYNDLLAVHTIVEADTSEQAERFAEEIGIYFNGVRAGIDCPCCGNRWSTVWDDPDDEPLVYDVPVTELVVGNDWDDMKQHRKWLPEGQPEILVHYKNRVTPIGYLA